MPPGVYPSVSSGIALVGRNTYLNLHGKHHHNFVRIPCFGILHAMERHDRPYGDDVLRIGETPHIEGQADVPDKIWWLEHSGEMRYRHALVRRDGAQELVGGDVVEVDQARCCAYKEKRPSEGDSEGCYWLAVWETRQ
jgi:hypothetical protein